MAKVAVVVVSDDEKFDLALMFAYRSYINKRFSDLKVLFFGPSQRRLAKLEGENLKILSELVQAGVVDSACVRYAENWGLSEEITKRGVRLASFGERLAALLNDGYYTITF
ncbi:hypothetical protein [Pyrobaculum aerophilum]|uniref:Peroxiredoxin n=2 Tax=Pyrobaculum aerophilum TaxID=13773 RepID=Q8ZUK2_PYRAE|nr:MULTISPECIES: hypothetical protein [Pyrobaculum]AAL64405.1 conserved hypothetical protein [Pyrobaculum aerophilum str. IM2]MCX8137986.1 hypothetical protein [Pyrobaculum aerophilum]RFA93047.1 hypothetical protein CGL51_13655 [Pyrobaculum aerophilum]RFA99306.1 hypothetical protein CGL52_03765 [Pyrobaculum aerophilum]HII47264.1 hypothetical protein [Pyrobaculum aerophilum]